MSDPGPRTYRDLEVELSSLAGDGTYTVRVLGPAPDGREMRSAEAERGVFTAGDVTGLIRKLERRSATRAELVTLGDRLAGLLLPGRVNEMFRTSLAHVRSRHEALRLRLRVEALEMAGLPWEYALVRRAPGEAVPTDFLALQPDVSVVRYETVGVAPLPLVTQERYRVVAALATTREALDVKADRDAIAAAVAAVNGDDPDPVVEVEIVEHATRASLLAALGRADIFHFAGHGVFEDGEAVPGGEFRRRGKIILEKADGTEDPFDSELLANALKSSGARLAVLGACRSGARDASGAWAGVAPALVRENVPAVVAMQFNVADARAPLFIAQLYLRVLQGYPVDQGVADGRQALFNQTGGDGGDWAADRDWGTPVLYLRAAGGVLFPDPPEPVQAAAAADGSPIVHVRLRVKQVDGVAVGARIRRMLSGTTKVDVKAGTVGPGGKLTGIVIDTLGTRPRRPRPR